MPLAAPGGTTSPAQVCVAHEDTLAFDITLVRACILMERIPLRAKSRACCLHTLMDVQEGGRVNMIERRGPG